jgi:hypothetical protein
VTKTFFKGNNVRCRGYFVNRDLTAAEAATFDADGTLPVGVGVDPTVVKFDHRFGSGTVTTDTYPTNITKPATGSYYRDVDTSAADDVQAHYRFYSTGIGQAAYEGGFFVKSEF